MKKNERLMYQLGEVEDKYIAEAFPTANASKSHIKRIIIGAMGAAAAGVIVWQGAANIPNRIPEKEAPSTSASQGQITNTTDTSSMATTSDTPTSGSQIIEFPKNSGELEIIGNSGIAGGAMGYEAYMVHDVSEIMGANPSRENCKFTELPVFYDYCHERFKQPPVLSEEEEEKKLRDIAGKLTDKEVTHINTNPDGVGYNCEAKVGNISLKMFDNGLRIELGTAVELPDDYNSQNMKDKEYAISTLNYLFKRYRNIIQMDSPTLDISTTYNIDGDAHTSYFFYDNSEDSLTALMNANFRGGSFDENLQSIFLDTSFSHMYENLAGMYSVISYDEAYEKLIGGDYITTVWVENDLPDGMNTDEIFFTGISYKRTEYHKYCLPYYRFLIELHPERSGSYVLSEGMKEYGAFYVPAVSSDYLASENTDTAFN